MYNNYIKLTEKYTRDKTRPVYVNLDRVHMIAASDGGTRLFINDRMYDVVETPELILGIVTPVVTTIDQLFTEEEDKALVRSRNEDGRPSNPAV